MSDEAVSAYIADVARELLQPVREYSEPTITRDADGNATVNWDGNRGYKGQTIFSDGMVDEYAKLLNECARLRACLSALCDATAALFKIPEPGTQYNSIEALTEAHDRAVSVLQGGQE